jgi:hypothetical protein
MNKYGLAIVVLMVTFFFSCNQGNKSNKVETVDSADVVVPVTIDEQNQLSELLQNFYARMQVRTMPRQMP